MLRVIFNLIVLSPLFCLFAPSADAMVFQTGETVDVSGIGNIYAVGNVVQVSKEIRGDAYLAGETILINAPIRENAMLAGQNVTINASLGDDVHAFGSTLIVNQLIRGDAILFGQKIILAPESRIGGSALIGGNSITVEGRIDQDVRMIGKDITLSKAVLIGNVKIKVTDSLTISEDSQVQGNLELVMQDDANILIPDGVILGEIKKELTPINERKNSFLAGGSGFGLLSFLSKIIIGGVILYFSTNFARKYVAPAKKNFWKIFGLGFLTIVFPPIAAVLLILPVITIPVAFIVLVAWGTILYLGNLFTGLIIANLFFPLEKTDSQMKIVVKFSLGTFFVSIVRSVPFIGFPFVLVFTILSIGSMTMHKVSSIKALKRAKIV